VVPRSDGEGEFGEGRWEPMLWVEFHAEFVVAAADVLDECVAGADHVGRAEPFEAVGLAWDALALADVGGFLAWSCSGDGPQVIMSGARH